MSPAQSANELRMLSRLSYDEEKCRNVLVRYCAHIPRNFQYQDGIPEVFLILREHMGDENLSLAGGVLYELIEIDCNFSDDSGAAFQRWKHAHMRRYEDLNLPHVPHMNTIMSHIRPTERLISWRKEHPERYPVRLSDSSPPCVSLEHRPSCVRTRKPWSIEYTLYVSSRDRGIRPVRIMNTTEFYKMRWGDGSGGGGKLVEERQIEARAASDGSLSRAGEHREENHKGKKLVKWIGRAKSGRKKTSEPSEKNTLRDSALELYKHSQEEPRPKMDVPLPLPDGRRIPNAMFARKHGLVGREQLLAQALPLMQTAEAKAVDVMIHLPRQSCEFRGPFTPQLGFDGGLDHRKLSTGRFRCCERQHRP